eukprot:SAG31_NODE_3092_length_4683_cov_2.003927_1_plen_137_part_00
MVTRHLCRSTVHLRHILSVYLLRRFSDILAELTTWGSSVGVTRYPPASSADRSLLPQMHGGELAIGTSEMLARIDSPTMTPVADSRTSTGSSGSGGGSGSGGARIDGRNISHNSRSPPVPRLDLEQTAREMDSQML